MEKNIGRTDKYIRLIIGTIIITSGIYFKSPLGMIGIIPIIVGIGGCCPLYSLFGISTINKKI